MADKKSSGCLKAFMITSVLSLLVMALLGGGGYYLWKTKGAPTLEQMQKQLAEGSINISSEGSGGAVEGRRPVVASAPMQAGPETYAQYVNRKDVLTLVNYYSDT